jgi:hypothetical protein
MQDRLPSWKEVRAMLVLGTKYQVNEMRVEAVRRIRSVIRRSEQEVEKEKTGSHRLMDLVDDDWSHNIIDMNNVTSSHALYNTHLRCLYECCQLSAEELVKGAENQDGSVINLHPEDLVSCIEGRLLFIEMQCSIIDDIAAVSDNSRCTKNTHCHKAINKLCRRWRAPKRVRWMGNPLGFGARTLKASFEEEKICHNCRDDSISKLKAGHNKVFNSMHTIFGYEEPQMDDVGSYDL